MRSFASKRGTLFLNLVAAIILVVAATAFYYKPAASSRGAPGGVKPGTSAAENHPFAILGNTNELGLLDPVDGMIHGEIRVENVSGKALDIQRVYTRCGCMDNEVDDEALSPGQQTAIRLNIRVQEFEKQLSKLLVAQLASGETSPIPVRATVKTPFYVHNRQVDFGRIEQAALPAEERLVIVEEYDKIKEVHAADSSFSVRLNRVDDTTLEVWCALPPSLTGSLSSNIQIATQKGDTYSIPVYAHVEPELSITPQTVSLFKKGGTSAKNVWIGRPREQVIDIAAPAHVDVAAIPKDGGVEMRVSLTGDGEGVPQKSQITITFKDDAQRAIPVYVWN